MSEAQLIAYAILQLKSESNVFKDYLFPIGMAFFSSLIGAIIGYLIYLRQEKKTLEKYKLDMTNKWLLMAYHIFQQLIGFKESYYKVIDSNPVHRVLTVPTILREEKNIVLITMN